jgi:proteic killer suppression protein
MILAMIKSFKGPEAKKIFNRYFVRGLPTEVQRNGRRKLEVLNAAKTLEDLRLPPGNRLEALKGDRRGHHSIRINDQWRICFVFYDGDAYDVEITDYH